MKQKILIMDDSATARALFRICFLDHPEYEIIEVSEWQDAIKQANSHQPTLVILDYNMPEKSGTEVAKLMQKNGIKSHFVLITANTQQSILNEAKALGFFDILEKPITAENIQAMLERLPC